MWRSVATSSSVPGETGIPARGGGRIGRKGGKGEEIGVCVCVYIYGMEGEWQVKEENEGEDLWREVARDR